jgi:carboxyl-terminal processing protease
MSDKFLQRGQVVVSQHGRAFPDQIYRAPHGSDAKYPIVVLVNRNTASAAEIVSGALQDHDRALIVGETTFGKGLVQTVYNLSENTGLALTTYHYYTPSGRLIQRNYTGVSLYDYYYNHAGALPSNSTNQEVKLTDAGRTVYGGGGITPDEKIDSPKSNHFQDTLLYKDVFFQFAPIYVSRHGVDKNFQVDDSVLAEFKQYLTSQNIPWTQADMDGVSDWLRTSIKDKIVTIQFGQLQGLRTMADWDPMIQKAITYLPEAQALEDNAHKVLMEKAEARNPAQ